MKKIQTLLVFLLLGIHCVTLTAQEEKVDKTDKATPPTPPSMTEFAPHFGYFFLAGDVDAKFGYGAGLSIRKATDYLFSLRLDLLYGMAKGESIYGSGPTEFRSYEMKWMSGTVLGIFGLNSLRFDKPIRKTHLYGMVGAGLNMFEVPEYFNEFERKGKIKGELSPHATMGAGFAIRLSPRMNIGIEHQSSLIFSGRADQLDGTAVSTTFRDIVNYTNLRLNFNLGNRSRRAEPLYWINPLQVVLDDIQQMKNESSVALQDSDGDGVIDQLDNEPNSAPGAMVDTKGRTLDSDRDGVPDHLDREPYYTPREGEQVDENGVVTNPVAGGGGVTEERVRELIDEALQNYQPTGGNAGIADLFLPMLHFGINSTTIKYSDYGTLASIARVLKDNPNIRLVIKGYTDQTGTETFNQVLSYERAKAVIDHLVNNHAIGRGRLILQYGGQDDALVPSSSSYMNRRVEFSVAKSGDVEMDPPAGYDPNKKSGY